MEISNKIDPDFLKKVCAILAISPCDTLGDNSKIKISKGLYLAMQLNKHKAELSLKKDPKKNSPSKQIEKTKQYLQRLKKLRSGIIALSPHNNKTKYSEMREVDQEILIAAQRLSNQRKSTDRITIHSSIELMDLDKDYLKYKFDQKLNELIGTLIYLEGIMSKTKKSFEQKKNLEKGKKQSLIDNERFIELCNLYYLLSGKTPHPKFTNKLGKILTVKGEIIDFLEIFFSELKIKHTRISLYQQFHKIISGDFILSRVTPNWLETGSNS